MSSVKKPTRTLKKYLVMRTVVVRQSELVESYGYDARHAERVARSGGALNKRRVEDAVDHPEYRVLRPLKG